MPVLQPRHASLIQASQGLSCRSCMTASETSQTTFTFLNFYLVTFVFYLDLKPLLPRR